MSLFHRQDLLLDQWSTGFLSSQSSSKASTSSYYVDWDSPSIYIKSSDGTIGCKKSDFAIQLNAFVEAGENTGFLADVQRRIDKRKLVVYAR